MNIQSLNQAGERYKQGLAQADRAFVQGKITEREFMSETKRMYNEYLHASRKLVR